MKPHDRDRGRALKLIDSFGRLSDLMNAVALELAIEREECAKIAEEYKGINSAQVIAERIRTRYDKRTGE